MDEKILSIIQDLGISISVNLLCAIGTKVLKLLPHQETNLTEWLKL